MGKEKNLNKDSFETFWRFLKGLKLQGFLCQRFSIIVLNKKNRWNFWCYFNKKFKLKLKFFTNLNPQNPSPNTSTIPKFSSLANNFLKSRVKCFLFIKNEENLHSLCVHSLPESSLLKLDWKFAVLQFHFLTIEIGATILDVEGCAVARKLESFFFEVTTKQGTKGDIYTQHALYTFFSLFH